MLPGRAFPARLHADLFDGQPFLNEALRVHAGVSFKSTYQRQGINVWSFLSLRSLVIRVTVPCPCRASKSKAVARIIMSRESCHRSWRCLITGKFRSWTSIPRDLNALATRLKSSNPLRFLRARSHASTKAMVGIASWLPGPGSEIIALIAAFNPGCPPRNPIRALASST